MAEEIDPRALDEHVLVDRAVANGDEHVIKFAEACLNRNAVVPSPAYPAAVARLLGLIVGR